MFKSVGALSVNDSARNTAEEQQQQYSHLLSVAFFNAVLSRFYVVAIVVSSPIFQMCSLVVLVVLTLAVHG
jgi:hypothetical protein